MICNKSAHLSHRRNYVRVYTAIADYMREKELGVWTPRLCDSYLEEVVQLFMSSAGQYLCPACRFELRGIVLCNAIELACPKMGVDA